MSNTRTFIVPVRKRSRPDIERLMIACLAYIGKGEIHRVNVDLAGIHAFSVKLPGEQSEPFKLYANYSRQFEVRLIDREVHVIARSLNTDSFTRAVAEGFARCCAEAWKTEMRNG